MSATEAPLPAQNAYGIGAAIALDMAKTGAKVWPLQRPAILSSQLPQVFITYTSEASLPKAEALIKRDYPSE